jgi:hypothetical protein
MGEWGIERSSADRIDFLTILYLACTNPIAECRASSRASRGGVQCYAVNVGLAQVGLNTEAELSAHRDHQWPTGMGFDYFCGFVGEESRMNGASPFGVPVTSPDQLTRVATVASSGQHLVHARLDPEQIRQILHLVRISTSEIVELRPVLGDIVELVRETSRVLADRPRGAVAVVARNIDDQRVVELTRPLDLVDHTSDLVVGVGPVRGEDVGLPDEHFLLVVRELIPALEQVIGPRCKLSGHVIDEERLVRIHRGDASQVFDRIVGLCRDQVPTRVVVIRIDRQGVAEQVRCCHWLASRLKLDRSLDLDHT